MAVLQRMLRHWGRTWCGVGTDSNTSPGGAAPAAAHVLRAPGRVRRWSGSGGAAAGCARRGVETSVQLTLDGRLINIDAIAGGTPWDAAGRFCKAHLHADEEILRCMGNLAVGIEEVRKRVREAAKGAGNNRCAHGDGRP
jgi:hypothetical protein